MQANQHISDIQTALGFTGKDVDGKRGPKTDAAILAAADEGRLAYAALAAEERRAAQNDYLRGGAERTQQLQLELALVGQTAETRARILALVRAEQDIRRLGLEGQAAEEARQRELTNVELARQVRAQSDAWAQFQQAGESAIDGVLDKLRGGDFKGALAEMLGELEKGLFDLSIRNPLKNLILGTDLGTMADLGGWSGSGTGSPARRRSTNRRRSTRR